MIKDLIKRVDRIFLNDKLRRMNDFRKQYSDRQATFSDETLRMEIFYQKNMESELAFLCDMYGSDKGSLKTDGHPYPWRPHTYTDIYELIFTQKRNAIGTVLECGLGTNNPTLKSSMGEAGKPGASLRVWRDYFPNARVIGVDIDQDILFSEDRIETYFCDQTSPESIDNFKHEASLAHGSVDVIIDDGLHEFFAGKAFLEGTFHLLAEDGIYIIEDVTESDKKRYISYLDSRATEHSYKIVNLHQPNQALRDNSLILIARKPPLRVPT
jgi:hypothetical protein